MSSGLTEISTPTSLESAVTRNLAPIEVLIRPTAGWRTVDVRELWRFRDLLLLLIWRDVQVRYRHAALGVAWAVLQPLITMIIFSVIFGRLAGLNQQTGAIPYPVFVIAGLLPWTLFSSGIVQAGSSLLNSQHLITKVYFPRLIVPLSVVGVALVDFLVSLGLLIAMMALYGIAPSPMLWAAIPIIALILLTAIGVGALLSALTVLYRDVRLLLPFLAQIWFFVTPIIYPLHLAPAAWRPWLSLNPLAGLLEGFRAALFGGFTPELAVPLALSGIVGVTTFVVGLLFFCQVERQLADVV